MRNVKVPFRFAKDFVEKELLPCVLHEQKSFLCHRVGVGAVSELATPTTNQATENHSQMKSLEITMEFRSKELA